MGYYITVEPEVNIYIEDVNPEGKTTILFIHGWPVNHKMFEYQFNQLPKRGYRCIGMDCRGFGNSDKPWSGYDYNRLADDVYGVVEALKLHDFILGGHSTGGAIATRYMGRHNGYKVAKLALFAAAVPSLIQRPYFPYGKPREVVENIIQGTYNDRPKMIRDFGDIFFFQYVTTALADWFFQLGLQAASWSTAAVANTWLGGEELFDDLGRINVPTLILHGIHDQVCPFSLAEVQKQGIKDAKLVPFENSGHALFWEEWEKFNRELANFIG